MTAMTVLTNRHTRRKPPEHRVTVMETIEDQQYLGRVYRHFPDRDGTIVRTRKKRRERLTFIGSHLVEELAEDGTPTGRAELLTPEEFEEQFLELEDPHLEYGFRVRAGATVHQSESLADARNGMDSFDDRGPFGVFEVVSRKDALDEWTVVGR